MAVEKKGREHANEHWPKKRSQKERRRAVRSQDPRIRSETPTVKAVLMLERIRSKPEGKERTIGARRKAEL